MTQLPSKVIDNLLKVHLTPMLTQQGFRRIGRTYYRTNQSWQELINIQLSYHSNRESGSFTINLGIFHEPTSNALGNNIKLPHEYDCQIRERLPKLINGIDAWWKFDTSTDIKKLGENTNETVFTIGLPYFQQYKSLSDIFHAVEKSPSSPIIKGVLAYYDGNTDKALEYLNSYSMYGGKKENWRQRQAHDVAQRIGLLIDPPKDNIHLCLSLIASSENDELQTRKKVNKIHDLLITNIPFNGENYFYNSTFDYPVYKFHIYGVDEDNLRRALEPIMKKAQILFKVTTLDVIT
jgi:uncharacterized protein DUF4304